MTKRRLIIFGSVLGLLTAGTVFWFWPKLNSVEKSYREFLVEEGKIQVNVLATGIVQPANRIEIRPPIAGRVEQVLVMEGEKIKRGQILAWMSSTERAALLDAARAQGASELKKWQDLYRASPLLSPINGTLILRKVEPGQTFATGDTLFAIADRLIVKAQVDETDIAKVKNDQEAQIVLDAYANKKIPAKVERIAFEAKTVNNVTTYTVDVSPVSSPPEFMRAGMTANITFYLEQKSDILVIPVEALQTENGQQFVLSRVPTSRHPEKLAVTTGLSDGQKTEVIAGLKKGQVVLFADSGPLSSRQNRPSSPFSPMGRTRRSQGR